MSTHKWHDGLFSCFNDLESCCLSCLCPCIQFGVNAALLNPQSSIALNCCLYCVTLQIGCCCLAHAPQRGLIIEHYEIDDAPCVDCLVTTFCACCSLAQESRQMKAKGSPVRMQMVTHLPRYAPKVYDQHKKNNSFSVR